MTRHTISLPDQMSAYIEGRIRTGQYDNVSEYVRDLIRKDQEQRQQAIAELQTMMKEAKESGISELSGEEIRTQIKKELGL
ncbi:MAG: addiction module antitoxin [Candidatus Entotheonella factor]|uniref:Addiction module antitoxin n=1 Tax=Entotheonella factor TaxID=1429438 RepID=W4L4V8_ENTF1|nr:MAG: addiction module antitoxin [Candidatus Entotheonella factor]